MKRPIIALRTWARKSSVRPVRKVVTDWFPAAAALVEGEEEEEEEVFPLRKEGKRSIVLVRCGLLVGTYDTYFGFCICHGG